MTVTNLRKDLESRLVSVMEDFTGLVNTVKSNFKTFEDDMVVLKMAMYSHSR